jgi:hypothetical protein
MPANDGTPRVWYSLLQAAGGGLRIEHRALAYDHQSAAAKMRRAGLPNGYADALSSGLWPNCDILPAKEKARGGQPLQAKTIIWRREAAFSLQAGAADHRGLAGHSGSSHP